jgi:hypothetical protein
MRLFFFAFTTLIAAEYHGEVKFAGLPLPGVTIVATQGDNALTAATDARGLYSFPDLPEGHWSLHAEKTGFAAATVAIDSDSPAAALELTMLPPSEIHLVIQPASSFQSTVLDPSSTPPDTEPAAEVTEELQRRAADGFLINGSALNGAASAFAQASTFGNARRGGRRLYTYAFSLTDSNSVLDAANYSLAGQRTPKPPFNNMTGTISFGGPLRIPRLLPGNGPTLALEYSRVENRASSV